MSEARRAWNLEHIGLVSELRCECARPNCKDRLPAVAETHRGTAGRFVMSPEHVYGDVVVRAADRFFVVEAPTSGQDVLAGLLVRPESSRS